MGESPILASNRNAFQTTSRETSYRLDVRISGAEETSVRKGKQGVRILLLEWQENLQGGTFRSVVFFACAQNGLSTDCQRDGLFFI